MLHAFFSFLKEDLDRRREAGRLGERRSKASAGKIAVTGN
jgi:hypothetical protein